MLLKKLNRLFSRHTVKDFSHIRKVDAKKKNSLKNSMASSNFKFCFGTVGLQSTLRRLFRETLLVELILKCYMNPRIKF